MNEQNPVREGGCLCGAFRFRCKPDKKLHVNQCSCRDCQKSSGGATATLVVVPQEQFEVIQGELKTFTVSGDSDYKVERGFCAICGSPVYGKPERFPELIMVRAPCFDEGDWIKPTIHFWMESRPAWAEPSENLQRFSKNPPF